MERSGKPIAKLNAVGNDRRIYIFGEGETKLSNDSGTQWFPVTNKCDGAYSIVWGNGRFVGVNSNRYIQVEMRTGTRSLI